MMNNHSFPVWIWCCRWSATCGSRARGDAQLQLLLSRAYCAAEDYKSAAKHYLYAENPIEFAQALVQWLEEGYESEADLFVTRVVLQYVFSQYDVIDRQVDGF